MVDLSVDLCGKKLKNPVIPASGTFGFGREFDELYDISVLGGVATAGLTLLPCDGSPAPRIAESHGTIVSALRRQNFGVEAFLKYDLAWLKSKTAVLANVSGSTLSEYAQICSKLNGKADFIELNLSCVNRESGVAFGVRPESVEKVTRAAKESCPDTPLIVKLPPNAESIAQNAQAAERGGADAIALVNTFTGLAVDIERRKPVLADNAGGVSGAGVKPIALYMVWEAAHAVEIPVVGMGGIVTAEDALEFLMAGATAVEVGTQNFTDPLACPKIIRGLESWCDTHRIKKISEIIGTLTLNE